MKQIVIILMLSLIPALGYAQPAKDGKGLDIAIAILNAIGGNNNGGTNNGGTNNGGVNNGGRNNGGSSNGGSKLSVTPGKITIPIKPKTPRVDNYKHRIDNWWGQTQNAHFINGQKVRLIAFSFTQLPQSSGLYTSAGASLHKAIFLRAASSWDRSNRNANFGEINPTRQHVDVYGYRAFIFGWYNYSTKQYAFNCVTNIKSSGYAYNNQRGEYHWVKGDDWTRNDYSVVKWIDYNNGGKQKVRTVRLQSGHHRGNTGKMRIMWKLY